VTRYINIPATGRLGPPGE